MNWLGSMSDDDLHNGSFLAMRGSAGAEFDCFGCGARQPINPGARMENRYWNNCIRCFHSMGREPLRVFLMNEQTKSGLLLTLICLISFGLALFIAWVMLGVPV